MAKFPDASVFYEETLDRARRMIDLSVSVEHIEMSESEQRFSEMGAAAGITALMGELSERGLLAHAE